MLKISLISIRWFRRHDSPKYGCLKHCIVRERFQLRERLTNRANICTIGWQWVQNRDFFMHSITSYSLLNIFVEKKRYLSQAFWPPLVLFCENRISRFTHCVEILKIVWSNYFIKVQERKTIIKIKTKQLFKKFID